MTGDEFKVPVKAWLKGSTYRSLMEVARTNHVPDVGTLVTLMVEQSIKPPQPPKRRWVRMTPERLNQAVRMRQAGRSGPQIAAELGVSYASVHAHLKRLGLQ